MSRGTDVASGSPGGRVVRVSQRKRTRISAVSMTARAIARPIHAQICWNSLSTIILTSTQTTRATERIGRDHGGRPAAHREAREEDRQQLPDDDGDREEGA